MMDNSASAATRLNAFLDGQTFGCVLADPFGARGKGDGANLSLEEICALPVADHMDDRSHCYLWVPNSLLPEGMKVLKSWGFKYTSNIIWQKSLSTGPETETDSFVDMTEILLFGIRGKNVRTLAPARSTVNFIQPGDEATPEAAQKPEQQYQIIERCSWGPFLELFAPDARDGWTSWDGQDPAR